MLIATRSMRHLRAAAGLADAQHQRRFRLADRRLQHLQRGAEFHRQLAHDDAMAADALAPERRDRLPAWIAGFAAERREAGEQDRRHAGCWIAARNHRNANQYISTRLTSSSGIAVGTCARITALGSSSSSSAAGTRLKFAAIGVISVPQ